MRNSVLHRSNISRERATALEELLSDKNPSYDSSPGVYVRSDKDRELDVLWQGFKINTKEERSPGVYLSIGFVTGAICMFLMTAILNIGNPSSQSFLEDLNLWKKSSSSNIQVKKEAPVTITPSSQTSSTGPLRTENYKIQDGDTLEKIALRFYGDGTPAKVEKIQIANNLDSPNQISAGKDLVIPLE